MTLQTGTKLRTSYWGGLSFPISQAFGELEQLTVKGVTLNQPHTGIDIAMPIGTQLFSGPSHTKVEAAGTDAYGGKFVRLLLDNGDSILFEHLNSVVVHTGQDLGPNSSIGTSGMTGLATGPHLHFELDQNGTPIDPSVLLDLAAAQTALTSVALGAQVPGGFHSVTPDSTTQVDCSQYNPVDPRYAICVLSNTISGVANNPLIQAVSNKQNWYKTGFVILGVSLVVTGVILYFFKEEVHAGEEAAGTVAGAAAKAP